ncbi:hypothetical protein AKJ09_02635 [Labilithrix luteola]|uniref:Uncharacterized protein n=2 Tax=Labilithrix luteola TaxID=1391654 RepID=A0A0K1PRG6_9BACT|nr:hypothetical protein AKJ09_02635 [Labilithrix luteola]
MAPNQLVTNEENLFDASGGERSACNARLVRVDFGDTCLRCGAIDVSLDGTRLGRAAAPKAPPTASHAWVRPQTHARAHAAIPSLAVSVEPNAAHRVDVAPAATPCTLTVPASGGASIEIAPGCETQAVEVRCAGF